MVTDDCNKAPLPPPLLSVAPMMDWTDIHYRQLARLMSRHTWLYTEMVVDSTLCYNPDHDRFLWFPPEQHPIVCQLGGSNPEMLAKAAISVAKYGYDEINLNCGCPSDRVAGAGCFGAALMLRPELVAECCAAMEAVVDIPITVKCRIGVDDIDSYEALHRFISVVSSRSSVTHFIIHARKCILKGFNPHQNRTIPPLRYQWIWALKRDFPHLDFSLNGGITTLTEVRAALDVGALDEAGGEEGVAGVMVGRAAYHQPWSILGNADVAIFGAETNASSSRRDVLERYAQYADSMIGKFYVKADGHCSPSVRTLTKPLLGLFYNAPRGKVWRAAIDEALKSATTVSEVIEKTIGVLYPDVLDAPPPALSESQPTTFRERIQVLPHWGEEIPETPMVGRNGEQEHTKEEVGLGAAV